MNRVCLIGRAGQDPVLTAFESGKFKTTVTMAVYRTKEETDWFDITAWDKTAEQLKEYVKKGHRFGVEGRLRKDVYEKDGQKQSRVFVVADRITLCESKVEQSAPAGSPF